MAQEKNLHIRFYQIRIYICKIIQGERQKKKIYIYVFIKSKNIYVK